MQVARSSALAIAMIASASVVGGCGGSSAAGNASVGDVQSCLQKAGYGVTVVPASQVTRSGPENRGPGQTGELLVGLAGVRPQIGADNAVAVVAFFDSANHAKTAPGTKVTNPVFHVIAIGRTTVQGTARLVEKVIRRAKSPAAARAAFDAQLKKIEGCV